MIFSHSKILHNFLKIRLLINIYRKENISFLFEVKVLRTILDKQLRVSCEDHNILLTETPLNPKSNREKLTQLMFEGFNCQGYFLSLQPLLALYFSGKSTGIVVDSGEGATNFVPFSDGYSFPYAMLRLNIAGREVTENLGRLIKERNSHSYSFDSMRDLKEKISSIAFDYETAIKESIKDQTYDLPDGKKVNISYEKYKCAECLFKPNQIKIESINKQNC